MTPRRVMITGGMRSGKSRFAEGLLADEPAVTYIAPGPLPDAAADSEWAAGSPPIGRRRPDELDDRRDHRHRRRAADRRATVPDRLPGHLADRDHRSAGHLGRIRWRIGGTHRPPDGQISWTPGGRAPGPAVAVTNEVGWGLVSEHRSRARVHRPAGPGQRTDVAAASDTVYLVVAGRALRL